MRCSCFWVYCNVPNKFPNQCGMLFSHLMVDMNFARNLILVQFISLIPLRDWPLFSPFLFYFCSPVWCTFMQVFLLFICSFILVESLPLLILKWQHYYSFLPVARIESFEWFIMKLHLLTFITYGSLLSPSLPLPYYSMVKSIVCFSLIHSC